MYCKICGASLAPGETLCKNCGASNANMEPKAPTATPIEPVAPVEAVQVQPEMVQPMGQPQVAQPMEPVTEVAPVQPEEEKKEEPIKKDNGKFLVVIGVIVGLLATAVIGYLVYSSLVAKDSKNPGADIVVVKQTNYSVSYNDYKFTVTTEYSTHSGKYLDIKKGTWNARIAYIASPDFAKLTADNIGKAFETVTDYKISEVTAGKSYSNLTCFEAKVDYTSGAKTLLLLCKHGDAGYWQIEIGDQSYTNYPANSIADEVATILSDAKKEEAVDSKLKIDNVNIVVEETEEAKPTETATE